MNNQIPYTSQIIMKHGIGALQNATPMLPQDLQSVSSIFVFCNVPVQ